MIAFTHRQTSRRSIFVLGTPEDQDTRRRMARAIALLQRDSERVIVALGNQRETDYMKRVALESGVPPSRLITDGNSRTTIDNAYYAKQICQLMDLRPEFLVASQYQISRATTTFKRVFGLRYHLKTSPSTSLASVKRQLRETILRILTPLLLFLFRNGDDAALKRASDMAWKLLHRRTGADRPIQR